ncbi:hypothetical protein CF15_03650 [Pyrodictium occultum]|uniref:Beta-ribofuranosylaminobenzene 5'-phosphate synthase n=1 Tax=Pyrodictium occultum TaxID=2309 RepID=A0A0V8RV50_PYROC|nr:hypothetical protein [Pyrodictium occultum]KSW11904.1 hypothetical protein CF15_03650 [Pyrodictium occultum]
MAVRVRVETGARLHLGFYGLCSSAGRLLGGIGIAVDGVGYRLLAQLSEADAVNGCDADRARGILEKAKRALGLREPLELRLEECIPSHVGLGSTTQLTLAIYAAVARLAGLDLHDAVEAAGRGPYSGIGVGAFLYGGFIVDAGVQLANTARPARPALHGRVPEEWRIVAVVPEARWRVEEGPVEEELMQLPRGSMDMCCKAMHALLRMIVPGIAESDFKLFTRGVDEIQRLTGSFFASAQSGLYCCPESEEAARLLRRLGARGVGQSSWGPLVYGFYPDSREAEKAHRRLREELGGRGRVLLLRPRNRGARIEASP